MSGALCGSLGLGVGSFALLTGFIRSPAGRAWRPWWVYTLEPQWGQSISVSILVALSPREVPLEPWRWGTPREGPGRARGRGRAGLRLLRRGDPRLSFRPPPRVPEGAASLGRGMVAAADTRPPRRAQGAPALAGTRNAVLNTEARTADADVLSRRCVLMRLLDFSYERYQRALRQSAGAVVVILPRALAAGPQDAVRVSPRAPSARAGPAGWPWAGHFTSLSPCPLGSGSGTCSLSLLVPVPWSDSAPSEHRLMSGDICGCHTGGAAGIEWVGPQMLLSPQDPAVKMLL